jgi:soluble lytic murein transglycosylase
MALASGDAGTAAREFEAYRTQFTQGIRNQQATYWAGIAHLQLGSTDLGRLRLREARAADPFSFYGIRAGERLEEEVMLDRLQPSPATTPEQKEAVSAAVVRLDVLRDLEWNEAAAFEQERINRHFADELGARYELAEQYARTNRLATSVNIGRELLRRGAGWDERLLRIMYPFPYRDIITREARKYGISPYLAGALIRQESAFNPAATSSAGAIGLMQVMPSTGRRLARTLGIRPFRTASLRSPEVNVRIGTRFLSDMMKAWDGRVDKVLAAYNAGPNRMERWAEFPEAREAELFMERIPFDETRDYVRVVQLNARIYQMLYGSGRSASAGAN